MHVAITTLSGRLAPGKKGINKEEEAQTMGRLRQELLETKSLRRFLTSGSSAAIRPTIQEYKSKVFFSYLHAAVTRTLWLTGNKYSQLYV